MREGKGGREKKDVEEYEKGGKDGGNEEGKEGERVGMGGEWEVKKEERKRREGRSVCAGTSVCMHVGGCGVDLICYGGI